MASGINFTPLYGSSDQEPFSYLIEIDECKILLDCGWNDSFDEEMLKPLKQVVNDIDFVLLSHPDLAHIGALPYAVSKLGLNCPIYATLPVWQMGELFMYDVCQSRAKFKFDTFDLDDIDAAFGAITQKLKYSQEIELDGKGEGIQITALCAGHTIGGTIWKIAKKSEEIEIIYAVDFNHKRERHLNGSVLEACCNRPMVLITDAYNALHAHPSRPTRAKELLETIMLCVRGGARGPGSEVGAQGGPAWGNVLLPVDTAGRVLELLLLLHQFWVLKKIYNSWYSPLIPPF